MISLTTRKVRAILVCRAILIICVSNHRYLSGGEKKLLPRFWLSVANNMGTNKYFSGHNLKVNRKET